MPTHHARKRYQNADIEIQDTRGAGAVIGAVRSARVLNRMKEGEATKAGVTEHKRYFRCDNGKANYAPPAEHSTWSVSARDSNPRLTSEPEKDHRIQRPKRANWKESNPRAAARHREKQSICWSAPPVTSKPNGDSA